MTETLWSHLIDTPEQWTLGLFNHCPLGTSVHSSFCPPTWYTLLCVPTTNQASTWPSLLPWFLLLIKSSSTPDTDSRWHVGSWTTSLPGVKHLNWVVFAHIVQGFRVPTSLPRTGSQCAAAWRCDRTQWICWARSVLSSRGWKSTPKTQEPISKLTKHDLDWLQVSVKELDVERL